MGTPRCAARRGWPDPRSDSRLVSRRARHAVRQRHSHISKRTDELGVHLDDHAHDSVARRFRETDAPLRARVVWIGEQLARRAVGVPRGGQGDFESGEAIGAGRVSRVVALIAMIVAFYAVSILWIMTDQHAAKHTFDESSAANTSDEGVSLAYTYLRRHRHVEMLTRLVSSDHLAKNGVVFRIGRTIEPIFLEEQEEEESPKKKPTHLHYRQRTNPLLTSDEAEWVEHGGRMVLAMAGAVGPLTLEYDAEGVAHKVFPFAPGIERIALPQRRGVAPSSLGARMVALYISGKSVVVSREPLGAGDIVVITVP